MAYYAKHPKGYTKKSVKAQHYVLTSDMYGLKTYELPEANYASGATAKAPKCIQIMYEEAGLQTKLHDMHIIKTLLDGFKKLGSDTAVPELYIVMHPENYVEGE